jgi:hypothetical protein
VFVGTNKRYPDLGPRLAEERELREARARGPLYSLSSEQLRLRSQVLSIAPEHPPMWALAWLRFGDVDVRCHVVVKRWTPDAVGVELEVEGETLRCWVWQGAVTRVERRGTA